MIPYKVKFDTDPDQEGQIPVPDDYNSGAVRIQAILYNSKNIDAKLRLFDADGDEFMFPIPGQLEPKVTTPEIKVMVQLPIYYVDEDKLESHKVVIFGEYMSLDK